MVQTAPLRSLEFYVDGANIPEVDFDVGPSWSGLMPISGNANETRQVGGMHPRQSANTADCS